MATRTLGAKESTMIIGVDYSTKFIDLAYRGEDMWTNTRMVINKDAGITKGFLEKLYGELKIFNAKVQAVYIEQPWMNAGRFGGNPKTSMQMVAVATIVQMQSIMLGYRVEWAPVVRWRSKVFGKGR